MPEELGHWLWESVQDIGAGTFTPCAELRTLRDYMLRLRSSGFLLPVEANWLNLVRLADVLAIRNGWADDTLDVPVTATRADWLYETLVEHPQDWFGDADHRPKPADSVALIAEAVAMLLPPVHVDQVRIQAHAGWLTRRVLAGLTPANLPVLDSIVARARDLVRRWAAGSPPEFTGALAERAVVAQPASIKSRLMDDREFLGECGIQMEGVIRFGEGPLLKRSKLLPGAEACQRLGTRQEVGDEGDNLVLISTTSEGLWLEMAGEGGVSGLAPDIVQLLSIDVEVRTRALADIVANAAPTGPSMDDWAGVVASGSLGDQDFTRLLDELQGALDFHMRRVEARLSEGVLERAVLFPPRLAHYEALCAQAGEHGPEEFLADVLPTHLRARFARDPVAGLDHWLAFCLRDDIAQLGLWTGTTDELWQALEGVGFRADPFSALGALGLCLGRMGDRRFADLADSLVQMLCSPVMDRGDGIDMMAYFPALVNASSIALRRVPGMEAVPVWWRDLCSWVHACMVARAMLSVTFDPAVMARSLWGGTDAATYLGSLLDLRQAPRRQPAEVGMIGLRAEILGRLHLLKERSDRDGSPFPALDALDAFGLEAQEQGFWHRRTLPGPLEGHTRPPIPLQGLPRDFRVELGRMLAVGQGRSPYLALVHVAAMSNYVCLGASVEGRCVDLLRHAPSADSGDLFVEQVGQVALAAVCQGGGPDWPGRSSAAVPVPSGQGPARHKRWGWPGSCWSRPRPFPPVKGCDCMVMPWLMPSRVRVRMSARASTPSWPTCGGYCRSRAGGWEGPTRFPRRGEYLESERGIDGPAYPAASEGCHWPSSSPTSLAIDCSIVRERPV